MSRKLDSIWDCSRMVMPEHKQRIIQEEKKQEKRIKPILDPQEWEQIERELLESMSDQVPITLMLFDTYRDREYKGIVMAVDRQLRRIKLMVRG